ncbi:MAG: DegT/DnrJ/EryC1/StrS family aminotransferase [Nocardioides sp.]|uniref:DegT/DnrJ/EryC1/StrS family aminotransferase n=1 Tax=Nocardioides sp. TaxID=35761 RepID=UPI0039E705EB
MTDPQVPFSSRRRQRAREQLLDAVLNAAGNDRFIFKQSVAELESAVRGRTGADTVVACAAPAGGIVMAANALGVTRDDRVAVAACAGPEVVAALSMLGARPAPVDVSPGTGVPDLATLRSTGARVALVDHPLQVAAPGPLGGPDIAVVHDATGLADALFASWAPGLWDDAAVTGLGRDGPLLAAGDGALVVTHKAPGRTVRMLRNHGQDGVTRFLHHQIGRNSRMDELVASFAVTMLMHADAARERTAALAARYDDRLDDLRAAGVHPIDSVGLPRGTGYGVVADQRDCVLAALAKHGIEVGPLLKPPPWLDHETHPGAATVVTGGLLLPLHPDLIDHQLDLVVATVLGSRGDE